MLLVFVFLFSINLDIVFGSSSGFWYGETRGPLVYDTVPYANLTVKILRPFDEGPGQNLFRDPVAPENNLFAGNTINRQSFDTQFVLDMEYALGIDRDRVYVKDVAPGTVHFSWESYSVIVSFIFLERNGTDDLTLLEAIAKLTGQIQTPDSDIYVGTNVTKDIDFLWGVQVTSWDLSLKLMYAIEVIGNKSVVDGYYLNQGGLGFCDSNETAVLLVEYCEFERFFEDDVSVALNISYYRVQILFIKSSALDSVLVHFRILPPMIGAIEANVSTAIANLLTQVPDVDSPLYSGNVTIRTDPTWGVSGLLQFPRRNESLFTYKYYDYDPRHLSIDARVPKFRRPQSFVTTYDRCKKNRRCNWGVVGIFSILQFFTLLILFYNLTTDLNQTTNDVRFYQRMYDLGELRSVNLFLDFEDWRTGTRGWSWDGNIPPTEDGKTSIPNARASAGVIRGTHFNPFEQVALGPDIPCYLEERNQGLVLARQLHNTQIGKQEALVYDLENRVDWINENIQYAKMDATRRSRKDVIEYMSKERQHFTQWMLNEVEELKQLNTSQCTLITCSITFNTTSLELTGAINDIGISLIIEIFFTSFCTFSYFYFFTGVIRTTKDGTEVAVFSFNSIYLGPDTKVELVGQRALALVSKTVAIINTTLRAEPGTLGGFQGGGSVARLVSESTVDNPRSIYICDLGNYCLENASSLTEYERMNIVSNNVNGPGSGNLRIFPFVMKTSATDVDEVQTVTTTAQYGQSLSGSFTLRYGSYVTPPIMHDASAQDMKKILEDSLNLQRPNDAPIYPNRFVKNSMAGIGLVNVTRSEATSVGGYTWTIYFVTAIGNLRQLKVVSYLQGLNASAAVNTITNGNEIGGSFSLTFHGYQTAPISFYESSTGLQQKLRALPIVRSAFVSRIDPTENCDDGLCPNGPLQSRGLIWSIYVTTDKDVDNITPTSPTSNLTSVEGDISRFTYDSSLLTGENASITLTWGLSNSPYQLLSNLNVSIPFSLAFGGAGGSYGGFGGNGYSQNPVGPKYNNEKLELLLGGSGGCMRSMHPFDINAYKGPVSGRGGHGGGALEVVAANDIVIGNYGKLYFNGGDGEQTSDGGGGGGSGGAILLAAGGTILHQGHLDASGGNGGNGGLSTPSSRSQTVQGNAFGTDAQTLDGGGGGGGRVAIFAESITNDGVMTVDGGKCGMYKAVEEVYALAMNVSMSVELRGLIDEAILVNLVATVINHTIPTIFVDNHGLSVNGIVDAVLNFTVIVSADTNVSEVIELFEAKVGTNVADIVVISTHLSGYNHTTIYPVIERLSACSNNGENGTLYLEAMMTSSLVVLPTNGAEGTSRALFLSNRESTFTASGSPREAPFAWNGPIIPFEPSQPTRVTYYSKMDSVKGESLKNNFGSLFSILSRGVDGLNVSSVIGVSIGDKIKHGANFGSEVDEDLYLKRMAIIDEYPAFDRWYKVDIHIRWDSHTYFILLDDTLVVKDQTFTGDDADGLRISVNRATDVWFDEIYVGFDNNLNYECPATYRRGSTTNFPEQKGWSRSEVSAQGSDGYTEYNKMTRHYSHLETDGTVHFDGQGEVNVFEDVKFKYSDGDFPIKKGTLHAGALTYLTNSARSARRPLGNSATLVSPVGLWNLAKDGIGGAGDGRHYLYAELTASGTYSQGGVAACSSQDLSTWRFEGIVFHNENLTDMVYGMDGPFQIERPTVTFNELTKQYVMWATMNDKDRILGLAAVASSPFEDGPFFFKRSLYPDGNRTRDQASFINDEKRPVLARTYYATVEYLVPQAVMQPIWESVKNKDGTINFRLNYHRANYDVGYDNYHDIYMQRWQTEDKAYNVTCVNRITGERRNVKNGEYNEDGDVCNNPIEYKVVLGLGNPPIETKFLSANNSDNSWWMQTSVPSVKAQPWASSYRDGYCGIRQLDDGYDISDPALEFFNQSTSREDCSNIADNPTHSTLTDKLIGVQRVILQRRAKYVAVSELTPDFMDTTGVLKSYEGELDSGFLISMIAENGQYGFSPGESMGSTFHSPVRSEYVTAYDYKFRFRQYIYNHNDRADYSLACVIDNICPVNFRDEIVEST
jgi:hypothetical protein